jgi:hypothetical protein
MDSDTSKPTPLKICGISKPDVPGAFDRVAFFADNNIAQRRALFTFLKAVDSNMTERLAMKAMPKKCPGEVTNDITLSSGAGEWLVF